MIYRSLPEEFPEDFKKMNKQEFYKTFLHKKFTKIYRHYKSKNYSCWI